MKKALNKIENAVFYYKDGQKISGTHDLLIGDVSGLRGDVSGLRGSIDECELTKADREAGIDVLDLVN